MTTRLLTHKVTCLRSLSSLTGQGMPQLLLLYDILPDKESHILDLQVTRR